MPPNIMSIINRIHRLPAESKYDCEVPIIIHGEIQIPKIKTLKDQCQESFEMSFAETLFIAHFLAL